MTRLTARDNTALLIFGVMRIFLSIWAIVAVTISPIPVEPDEVVRPYLGEPQLADGPAGLLLGPWQRFDTQRYMHIARQGYAQEKNSVFPPLYPLSVRAVGHLIGGDPVHNLLAGILLSNLACLALFILFHRVVASELDPATATRALVYLVLFPTGFFLFAPYTEPIFMLFALGSLWAARRGRFWTAGILGFLAALTRLTGWILVAPLAYEYWSQRVKPVTAAHQDSPQPSARLHLVTQLSAAVRPPVIAIALPGVALLAFVAWRWSAGLPPLNTIYARYWYQTTGFPGSDLITAARTLFFGGQARNNEIIPLSLDVLVTLLLVVTTILAYRRLGITYGLYATMLLLFMLLPSSEVKPLYSFSRYALAFFPTFMLLALAGRRPLINRLILYPSLLLHLYLSGQFFVWGWVA
jgi:hypothetical protein